MYRHSFFLEFVPHTCIMAGHPNAWAHIEKVYLLQSCRSLKTQLKHPLRGESFCKSDIKVSEKKHPYHGGEWVAHLDQFTQIGGTRKAAKSTSPSTDLSRSYHSNDSNLVPMSCVNLCCVCVIFFSLLLLLLFGFVLFFFFLF